MIGLARQAHACTHTTFAPTVMHGGTKTNVIPDRVELEVDIRTLPGQTGDDVRAMLDDALGDLADDVEVTATSDDPSTASPIDTPLWDALERVTGKLHRARRPHPVPHRRRHRRPLLPPPGHPVLRLRAVQRAHSASTTSPSMFHGDDERVDQESLRLSTELWHARRPRPARADSTTIRAVLWDFGGVILSSPFEAFARYEREQRPARRLHPHPQRHQPRHQRVGPARAQRRRHRRVLRAVRSRGARGRRRARRRSTCSPASAATSGPR